ncbi:MAG TPA: TonB-dependent receptor plug domain-containing protein [Bacteroidales bacterium]|nr:TonB-dependent receptor plug domain-containing protein [Bacteroidales bacterium]
MKKYLIILSLLCVGYSVFSQVEKDTTRQEAVENSAPVISLSISDVDGDEDSQDISGLLQSSKDIFVSTAGYTFGQSRYNIRGYDSDNTQVMINGVTVNDINSGRAYWSNWGGLNDATRNTVVLSGLGFYDYGFGRIGGATNIITRASEYMPQTRVSYSLANKSYNNRLMFIHSTGMMENGWAFTASGSKRWAVNGYSEGSFYDAYSYFVAAEKKLNNKHSFGLTIFGSPSRRGGSSVSIQEIYDLTGDHYYNSNWGYQNGEVRNARVSNYHQPHFMLTHYYNINEKMSLTSSLHYTFGRGGSTALNWYDAADPRPDYYRYLPSYWEEQNPFMVNYLTNLWQNDELYRQLDWDAFYDANRNNLYTVNNVNDIDGNNVTGYRSKYIIEDRRNDIAQFDFNTTLKHNINPDLTMISGINITKNRGHHFKEIVDLLGGDWWLDIDQFAERDFNDEYTSQSDIENYNRLVTEGDVFGYNYYSDINIYDAFTQIQYKTNYLDFYAGIDLSYTEFWRTGMMRNGKFPSNSKGESEHQQFFNYNIKGGVNYKITGRNFLILNAAYLTKAPYFRYSYVSPRTRNDAVEGLSSETIMTGDLSYIYRSPFVQARITGYYTDFTDQLFNVSFYHDELNTFVNYIMTGVDKLHYGGELGVEVKASATLTLHGVLGYGQYIYNSRPTVTIAQDNDSEILAENRTVYLKDYHVGGMPELAASVGFKYNAPKYWFVGVNGNYFGENYVTPNPERRTEETLTAYISTDPQLEVILEQEKLDHGFTIDIWGGKSWKIDDYYLGFTLSVNNILNNKDLKIKGFEQYRFEPSDYDKFPNKYYYMYGRTYFLNVYFRF